MNYNVDENSTILEICSAYIFDSISKGVGSDDTMEFVRMGVIIDSEIQPFRISAIRWVDLSVYDIIEHHKFIEEYLSEDGSERSLRIINEAISWMKNRKVEA